MVGTRSGTTLWRMMDLMELQINIDAVGVDMSEWLTVRETYFERTVKRMRLIDADVLIPKCKETFCEDCISNVTTCLNFIRTIIAAPTIDAVEVVRCKDCKYYVSSHCEIRGKGLYLIRGMNDYCSRAERRSDD